MAGISLSGITKSFSDTPVLRGIDLDIRDGEFLTLVGPSGCGKSTLLRIIAGLESQTGGDVHIGDRLVNTVRPADRNLAMVFQSYALYPHLTVGQNMAVPLRLRSLSFLERFPIVGRMIAGNKIKAIATQVSETAQVLQIEQLLARKPGQLSGGQRQRAALGRAMVRKPVAFLMDEPLSNLDAALRVHMRAELAELHRDLDATFIYVTHDQAEALTMSDRMAVMMGGEILQLHAPSTVYEDPIDLRVAQFVGSPKINVLDAACDFEGRVHLYETTLNRRLSGAAQGAVRIGLRPEHLDLVSEAGPSILSGTVVHRENMGSDIFLHVDLGAHRIVVRADPLQAGSIDIGQTVHATPQPGKALAFGKDGARLRFLDEPQLAKAVA
ncbi:MAG: ABC transporter ATP-binding protein [Pseudomonadota bacterium]